MQASENSVDSFENPAAGLAISAYAAGNPVDSFENSAASFKNPVEASGNPVATFLGLHADISRHRTNCFRMVAHSADCLITIPRYGLLNPASLRIGLSHL